jgi:hypothetical protein
MSVRIPCFLLTPTNEYVVSLRRYVSRDKHLCVRGGGKNLSYCNASVNIDVFKWDGIINRDTGNIGHRGETAWGWGGNPVTCDPPYTGVTSYKDHRWPKGCDRCGEEFPEGAEYQLNLNVLFSRSDGGPLTTLREASAGAMWYADWWLPNNVGPDGHVLTVRIPGGHDWMVDGRASNCTRKDDKTHRCWVRHGTPPLVTVDKNGDTCQAGAGSIQTDDWHGFLRNGFLERC